MIGDGVQYVARVDSSIEAFFSAPIGTKINIGIDVTLDTEPDCDFLYLSVKSSGGVEDFLLRSKSRDGKRHSMGSLGERRLSEGPLPSLQSPKVFCFSQVYLGWKPLKSLVLLSTRSLSLLLEIFRLV
ncbi:hypothetical protein BASA60_002528 [Batrachochytrium salamandrivorans]|nr:hypothetical protein BASA60_002528 [Batrachochytrium salamandrivorans]